MPAAERNALLGAVARLLGARAAVALLPYATVRRLYARPAGRLPLRVDPIAYRRRAIWGVRAAGRWVLGERPCLAQALVAERLLRRSGAAPRLCIGVARGPAGKLLAHAWVECDGVVVVGRRSSPARFTPLRALQPDPPVADAPFRDGAALQAFEPEAQSAEVSGSGEACYLAL